MRRANSLALLPWRRGRAADCEDHAWVEVIAPVARYFIHVGASLLCRRAKFARIAGRADRYIQLVASGKASQIQKMVFHFSR